MSVYFATCRAAGAVKIGSSLEPWGRLPEIQLGSPLPITIEAILPGGLEEEFAFHRRFADDRLTGEWFTINEMIELIISANRATPPVEMPKRSVPRKKKQPAAPQEARDWNRYWRSIEHRSDSKRYAAAMAEMQAAGMRP